MILFYVFVAILGVYLLSRRIDLVTVAYLSAIVYFMPAFLVSYEMPTMQYVVYATFFLGLVLCAVATSVRFFSIPPSNEFECSYEDLLGARFFGLVSLLSVGTQIAVFGISDFFAYKTEQLRNPLIGYLWSTALAYAFLLALKVKSRFLVSLGGVQYFLLFMSGDRTHVAIAAVSSVIFFLSRDRRCVLRFALDNKGTLLLAMPALFLFAVYGKDVYGSVYVSFAGGGSFWEVFIDRLAAQNDAVSNSEPYFIQSMLTRVIEAGTSIPPDYLAYIPVQFLPWSGELGGDVHVQSRMFKELFFSDWSDEAGVSSNILAEAYSVAGLVGVIVFCSFYSFVLLLFQYLLARTVGVWRICFSIMAAYWTFYIHRNSILQMIGHEKRIFYFAVLSVFLIWLVSTFARRAGPRYG